MSEPQIQQRAAQPYLGIPGTVTDGVPAFVDGAEGDSRVRADALAAGRCLTCMYVGPYRTKRSPISRWPASGW